MTAVVKQDSNFTELRYSIESAPNVAGTVWYPLEPNSYKNFGGEVKTKQRMPINSSRQLKKPVVVDLDAGAGFVQDLTATNSEGLMQSFMYAVSRTKDRKDCATVDGTLNAYTVASGGLAYEANDLIFAQSLDDTANDGLKKVSTGTVSGTSVPVTDTGLVDAATQVGTIERVGYEFDTGKASIDASGTFPKLVVSNTAAVSTLTGTGVAVSNGDTVTITGDSGATVYTFQTVLTAGSAGQVHVLINGAAGSLTNLFHAINNSGGTAGVDYSTTGTGANPHVTATNPTGTTVVATAIVTGRVGNRILTARSAVTLSWTGTNLSGGLGRDLRTLDLIQGEPVFVGGDDTATVFFNSTNLGYCRLRSVAAGYLEFDKTHFVMVADDGTSTGAGGTNNKNIQIFFGRIVKNESDSSLIVKRGLQLERQLGFIDDSTPSQIQAEYLVRSLANDLKFDMKTADIIRLEFDLKANTNEVRTASEGLKTGTRPTLVDSDAFNSTSDVAMTKICIVSTTSSCPAPLFSFFTDLIISLKNNLKQNKAVSVLGAFDSTPGFFHVAPDMTAYFVTVDEITAVKNNRTLTLETHLYKFNKGMSFDMPCLVASKAMADVKLNEPIMMPLQSDAAAGTAVHTGLNHTLLITYWDYLPALAGTL